MTLSPQGEESRPLEALPVLLMTRGEYSAVLVWPRISLLFICLLDDTEIPCFPGTIQIAVQGPDGYAAGETNFGISVSCGNLNRH
jgi:hypothetical protein